MFSPQTRRSYGRNPILEVVCQYRFPTILKIESESPAAFQDAIRDKFPRYECRREQPAPRLTLQPGQMPKAEQLPAVNNHCFSSLDGTARVNLTRDFIALTVQKYDRWENFAGLLDKVLCEFIKLYAPAAFDRIGLRYVNAVSRKALGLEEMAWRELIHQRYLGALADEIVSETAFSRCSQDLEMALPGGCRLKLHAGPGLVRRGSDEGDQETKFVLDLDISMTGNLPVSAAAGALSTLHAHSGSIFENAITDTLRDAMEPEE